MPFAPSNNPTSPTVKFNRPSQSVPEHRRPSWAKKEISYKTYITNATARPRIPGDFGLDNFAYDETHIAEWRMPAGLTKDLPKELNDACNDWVYAGAALCTALDRVQKMDNEAIDRADPATTHQHILQRRTSIKTAGVCVNTPTTSIPAAQTCSMPLPVVPFCRSLLITPFRSSL